MSTNEKYLILSAFGIHTGGGMVLLKSLLHAIRDQVDYALIDSRLASEPLTCHFERRVTYVRKSMLLRLLSMVRLSFGDHRGKILFCFNSLPPIIRVSCKVIVYVHAPHYAGLHKGIKYTTITRARIFIERSWFNLGIANCDEIWVQTASMAESIRLLHPNCSVRIVPFVDDELTPLLPVDSVIKRKSDSQEDLIFLYPADAVGHKNHSNLLKAWAILRESGFAPKLLLTLTSDEFRTILQNSGFTKDASSSIVNLGRISRSEVLGHIKVSSAVIFPSLAETFGLPMIEARLHGVPIIASERDFVRDVCSPVETFDPSSPKSIARAVMRFMRSPEPDAPLHGASSIAEALAQAR